MYTLSAFQEQPAVLSSTYYLLLTAYCLLLTKFTTYCLLFTTYYFKRRQHIHPFRFSGSKQPC